MNKTMMRSLSCGFLAVLLALTLVNSVHAENKEITPDLSFAGKTECENGQKKAGFKDAKRNIHWFTAGQVAQRIKDLTWPDSSNSMSFDAREAQKVQLQHVSKTLRDFSCDTQDSPAQSNGLLQGAQNPTQNGTTANSYIQPQ